MARRPSIDYKKEFKRLLGVARQATDNVDFTKRKVLSFAAQRALRNAVDYYESEYGERGT